MKEVNLINASQNGFMENKSHQTGLIAFSTLQILLTIKVGLMKYTHCTKSFPLYDTTHCLTKKCRQKVILMHNK